MELAISLNQALGLGLDLDLQVNNLYNFIVDISQGEDLHGSSSPSFEMLYALIIKS